jgi:hypothetical protein
MKSAFYDLHNTSLLACSLAGRYDNPFPTRFLCPIDCSKNPALVFWFYSWSNNKIMEISVLPCQPWIRYQTNINFQKMKGAYILVFIRNEAYLAHFFRQMPMKQKWRKTSTFLTICPVLGPDFGSLFRWKIADFRVLNLFFIFASLASVWRSVPSLLHLWWKLSEFCGHRPFYFSYF